MGALTPSPGLPRAALYAGARRVLPASPAQHALSARARHHLLHHVGAHPQTAIATRTAAELFPAIGAARRAVYLDAELPKLVAQWLRDQGDDPAHYRMGRPKLRAVHPLSAQPPAARPLYAVHRDTWYGEPQGVINLWLPLFDTPATQAFTFWPDAFAQAVPNDSAQFDYTRWAADEATRIGWQRVHTAQAAHYPAMPQRPPGGEAYGLRQGEALLFSGAHLHGTLPHHADTTRFSMDLRLVHRADHAAGRGAPNADARCTGSALDHYLPLPEGTP